MKNKKLKIAFIGGGINSAIGTTHKIASQMDSKFELIAGCFSRNESVNEQTAERWHVEKYYKTYTQLLENEKENLDAVILLTPTNTHAEILLDIIKYKVPIICEKTLTTSSAKALEIQKKLNENKLFLATTYNYTGYPMLRELKEMIQLGKLGKVIQINIQMPQESFIRLTSEGKPMQPQAWRLHDEELPILSLDLGTHLSNMVYFLTQKEALEVIAMQNSFGHYDVIDNINCMIKYEENIDCQMWYSKSALGHKNGLRVEVYGEEGSAMWSQMDPEFLEFNDNLGRNIVLDRSSKDISIANQEKYNRFKSGHPAGFIEAFANHYDDIYDALVSYKKKRCYESSYIFDVVTSTNGLFLMEAIAKSIETKRWEIVNA